MGGEFIDANGLRGSAPRRDGPRIVVGFQDFAENETLAHLCANVFVMKTETAQRLAVQKLSDLAKYWPAVE